MSARTKLGKAIVGKRQLEVLKQDHQEEALRNLTARDATDFVLRAKLGTKFNNFVARAEQLLAEEKNVVKRKSALVKNLKEFYEDSILAEALAGLLFARANDSL